MKTELLSKAEDFLFRIGDKLLKDEARYGLILGIARGLINDPHEYGDSDPWFCILSDESETRAVAMRTPPHLVLLGHISGDSQVNATWLANSVLQFSKNIPGVVGDQEIADSFVNYWCKRQKVAIEGKIAHRVYRLVAVRKFRSAPGKIRLASEADQALLTRWAHAFHQDVYAASGINVPEDNIVERIERKDVYVWEDNIPVSMAAKARSTENGMRINFVYTPSELRRRGYATSCVASLCQQILNSRYQFCMLYADLANPTSNSIYQRIGFEAVCDSVEYSFSGP